MKLRICLVSSHGGHLTETLQLLDAFQNHHIFFVTYKSSRDGYLKGIAPVYLTDNIGTSPSRLLVAAIWAWGILRTEKPDYIVSLGAEIAIPFFYIAKVLGIKTIYIESWCRIEDLSLTGKIVYPVASRVWVQWPELLEFCGSKAEYHGAVI